MANIVNKSKPYILVYSIHPINILGMSMSIYAVQLSKHGNLSYRTQKLSPLNIKDFTQDKLMIKHIEIINSISLMSIYEKYSDKNSNIADFFKTLQQNKSKQKIIRAFIDKQISTILNDLKDLENPNIFLASKDGYPAYKKLNFQKSKGNIVALVKKGDKGIFYSVRIKLNNKFLKLFDKNKSITSHIIVYENNPTIVINDEIIFLQENSATKLKPFLKQEFVFYPKEVEKTFITKVLPELINKYEVRLRNFNVVNKEIEPEFLLEVQFLSKTKVSIIPKIIYENAIFNLNDNRDTITFYHAPEGEEQPIFQIIQRNYHKEKLFKNFWQKHFNSENSLYFSMSIKNFIQWIEKNKKLLNKLNIKLKVNKYGKNDVILTLPELNVNIQQHKSKLLLQGNLIYDYEKGKHAISLSNLNPKNIDDFIEIEDKYFIIPEDVKIYIEWLLNTSEKQGDKILIEPYQIAIIEHLLKEKLKRKQLTEEDLKLPEGITATLRPYQVAGYQWLLYLNSQNYGGILADEMGLGKTLQTIALLQKMKEINKNNTITSLIVVPNALISNWKREFQKFAPNLSVNVYHGTKRKNLLNSFYEYDVWITTYGTMRADIQELKNFMFYYVVLDESHYIKNKDAQVSKAAYQLKAHYKLALTGTPLENNLSELWSQMHFINPNMLGSFSFFKNHFIEPVEKFNNEERLNALSKVISPFILRRTKKQVLKDLPPKLENIIMCDMLPEQRRLYYENASYFHLKISKLYQEPKARMQILAYLQKLRQIAIHPKLINPAINKSGKYEVLKNLIEEILANNSKALIFSHYVKTLNLLRILLDNNKIDYAYIDGRTKDRQKQVDKFNNSEHINLFLISIKAGGVGLNLPTADTVILLDPWWNPAVEQQAISRAHRIGQKNVLNVYKLITKDSIEEKILKLQQEKQQLFNKVMKNELSFIKKLSLQELQELVEIPKNLVL